MKICASILILLVLLSFGNLSFADEFTKGRLVSIKDAPLILTAVVPDEYRDYLNLSKNEYNLDSCKAAIRLVDRVHQLTLDCRAGMISDTPHNELRSELAQLMAWSILVQTWKLTSDKLGKDALLQAWNSALEQRPEDSRMQITALMCNWDKALLTDQCFKVFEETENTMVIHAFCMIFGEHGEDKEIDLLRTKLVFLDIHMKDNIASLKMNRSNIQYTLGSISFRRSIECAKENISN